MSRYWTTRTRTLYGYALPAAEPGKAMWQPSSAIRRAENAVHERRLARRYVQLAPGVIVVWERQPWQIVSVDERPDDLWGDKYEDEFAHHLKVWESRKLGDKPERHTWRGRPIAVQIVPVADLKAEPIHLLAPGHHQWDVLPEHYAVCVACGDLPPCRHELAEQEGDLIAARADVLMDIPPGHCLGCGEYVTTRQQAARFPGPNLWRPDMPEHSAVFHARQECAGEVERYRRQWEARGNTSPQPSLFADDDTPA
jgi:hypothetical protein